jgi:hypothetical protein
MCHVTKQFLIPPQKKLSDMQIFSGEISFHMGVGDVDENFD